MWTSEQIPGRIQGRPIPNQSLSAKGQYIFFTHNIDTATDEPVGAFSMMLSESGELIFTEIAGDSPNDPAPEDLRVETLRLPYGPLGVAPFPQQRRFTAGQANSNDLFVWSTSVNDGIAPNGYVRAFQLPTLFQPQFAGKIQRRRRLHQLLPFIFSPLSPLIS